MRRKALILASLALLASSARSGAATDIAFGITSSTAFSLPHYIATEKKYYETENLAVDTIVAGAAMGVLKQLAAGSLNIAQAATDQSLRAILHGAPIKIIAGAASNAPFRCEEYRGLERPQGEDDKRRRPHRCDALLRACDGKKERPRRSRLRSHLWRQHAQPVRPARVGSGGCGNSHQSRRLHRAGAGVCRSRQRAAIPAELGAEQYSRRYALGAVEPGAHPRVPAGTYQSNEISSTTTLIATRSSAFLPGTRIHTPQIAAATYDLYMRQQVIAREASLYPEGIKANLDALVEMGELTQAPPLAGFIDASFLAEASR